MTEETKRKIGLANSISLKGRKLSKEHIEKTRQRMFTDNPMRKDENKLKISNKLKGIKRDKGKESKLWKGNNITYFHFHKWLKDNFGKANKCENINCSFKNPKRFEWSLLKGKKYQRKRENFWQLCASCHRKYDYTEEQRIKCSTSHKGMKAWDKNISFGKWTKEYKKEYAHKYYIDKAEELKEEANKL